MPVQPSPPMTERAGKKIENIQKGSTLLQYGHGRLWHFLMEQ